MNNTTAQQQGHEEHDAGLEHDIPRMADRRRVLGWLGGAGVVVLGTACGSSAGSESGAGSSSSLSSTASTTASTTPTTVASNVTCEPINEETAGPFPGDGSNGPNVLTESGVVRSDITTSFGASSGTADGTPMQIEFTVLDTANGCAPYAGAAVYVWHCDRDGGYSMYSQGVADQNYLRGVLESDANGIVRFASIFPACYDGRWPHIHFEVYPSLAEATSASSKLATSQIAIPEEISAEVYSSVAGYESSVSTFERTSLESDGVFRDGWARELGTVSGTIGNDLKVSLTVPV